jgi:hypothetical protein
MVPVSDRQRQIALGQGYSGQNGPLKLIENVADFADPANNGTYLLTPEGAGIAKARERNRNPGATNWQEIVRDIRDDRWTYNEHDIPAMFDKDGLYRNGGHRAQAVLKSGLSIVLDVAFGVPANIIALTDTNKSRSLKDRFFFSGNKKTDDIVASIVRCYFQVHKHKRTRQIRIEEAEAWVDAHRESLEFISRRFLTSKKDGANRIPVAMAMMESYETHPAKAEAFIDSLFNNALNGPVQQATKLRLELAKKKGHGGTKIDMAVYLGTKEAFDAYLSGRTIRSIRSLRLDGDELKGLTGDRAEGNRPGELPGQMRLCI